MSYSLSHGKGLDVGEVGIDQEGLPAIGSGPVDLSGWFGAGGVGRPIELEIGSGKGTFIVGEAGRHPEVNYIGIEYAKAFWRHAADRCRRHGLSNVRMVHCEAGAFVRQYVADGVLRGVHIYFPDPWPKARHHKRRLVQADFLRLLHRKLCVGARVQLVTDHAGYFEWMREHVGAVGDLFEVSRFEPESSVAEGELVGTNFERKYIREGRAMHALTLTAVTS